jgi:hypothetical protein
LKGSDPVFGLHRFKGVLSLNDEQAVESRVSWGDLSCHVPG